MSDAKSISAAALLGGSRLIDCTQTIDPGAFTFVGCFNGVENCTYTRKDLEGKDVTVPFLEARFRNFEVFDTRAKPEGYRKCIYRMACDVGTHIDSPAHWYEGKRDVSQLTMDELVCPGVVIDVKTKVDSTPLGDYQLSIEDVEEWVSQHGAFPARALVCMKTGWSSKFNSHSEYMGTDEKGGLHYPGFGVEAVRYMIDNYAIQAIGIDTASLDYGPSSLFEVHQLMLGSDKYQIENMVLDGVPPSGVTFVSLPLKVKDGPESETRVMAIVQ